MAQKTEVVAMLLAGGQGSRLGVLTKNIAKPAVPYGGNYRIIDFPLSNCVNSGIYTVGVLTQYQPLELNDYLGNGQPWDLDRQNGGIHILSPYEAIGGAEWYKGTANAIYQNINFIEKYDPEYVVILSGDHIYKMNYAKMVDFHKKNNADCTIAVLEVPWEEASRFGILATNDDDRIYEFAEKPKEPKSNKASMGVYVFSWDKLKKYLIQDENTEGSANDFGKNIIPTMLEAGERLFAFPFSGYWKDVGTLSSYWEANMELIDIIPEFNLYEEFWKIYTNNSIIPPQYISKEAVIDRSIIGDGAEIYGEIHNCVIGAGVVVGQGCVIRDSIIMQDVAIGNDCVIDKAIIAENVKVGDNVTLGIGNEAPNKLRSDIYNSGLVTIGENSVIPAGVQIGKNTAISGITVKEDYVQGALESGGVLIKAGDRS